jgi:hypothetical protein
MLKSRALDREWNSLLVLVSVSSFII